MTQTTRTGKQNNPALLAPTDLPGTHTTHGYRMILDGARAIIRVVGWDRLKQISDAISARYTALLSAPTRLHPGVTGQPTISNVTSARVGQKLSLALPTYDGVPKPTLAFQWVRGASTTIAGATLPSYTPVAGDVGLTLKCTITASNGQGTPLVETTPVTNAVLAA